jgi:glycosyltransferase involved in cell wall biosynthesis
MNQSIVGLVSTIIPVRDRPTLLIEAVESVLAQTYRPVEIIIVDDGSIDETPEVAKNLAAKYPVEVKYRRQVNQGPGAARELGRQTVRGEFIQYLDSDDLLLPDKYERQVAGLRANPECAVSYGKTRYYRIGETPKNIAHKRTGERIKEMFPAFLQSRWWSTSTPLFSRSICDRAGSWLALSNEEDWEYDCRIASFGVRLHYCDQFVSDTRDHNDRRLCKGTNNSPAVMKDRAYAHELIYQHAIRAAVKKNTPEMQHFARELFFLSRQCGAVGLPTEAKQLFLLARDASGERGNRAEFLIYEILANLFGWSRMGAISDKFDWLRSKINCKTA